MCIRDSLRPLCRLPDHRRAAAAILPVDQRPFRSGHHLPHRRLPGECAPDPDGPHDVAVDAHDPEPLGGQFAEDDFLGDDPAVPGHLLPDAGRPDALHDDPESVDHTPDLAY